MALAALLGGAVGLQREYVGKEAGFRTHALVSAGSALIMLVSIFIFEEYRTQSAQIDPSRIAAQVVSGIGFLGAGAIIRAGVSVIGLTTAACLWSCAAIGLACGVGFYEGAIYGTLIVLVILVVFQQIEILLIKRKKG
ncbi:MAG: MgtC/SapB family protein [Candidatus Omnitrophica bacterium]|nr:MgtC/SapB family protein [Candidatus Omnitrophota bacterium]